MDYRALKDLVRRGEGSNLEFKLKTNHPEKIIRGVVAFANTNGGIMLIGVGDDRTIPGLKYADEDEYLLVRAIDKYCFPKISYTIERVPLYDEREVLVIRVPPSPNRPHYIIPDLADPENKKAYVRVADKSVQASKEVREIMKGERASRDIRFTYGDKERKLMQHLGEHNSITVDLFASIAGVSRKIASRTLVLLVLANVLEIHPSDVVDKYTSRAI
ncbi:putative transcriptional regulator [Fibrisoma limi BUZ 3]|uniref:Putative transcriptional regulator n=1 Tax=Fibrisoma limi BUZ 3 TaxID=1185876 RepID=I2GQY8_9BACT|nr:ATP-binding protein [Fibrisoma limi]CCH56316.1 putative transcriptional regulator [Fibrisoma limi BUZ 3]